MSGMLISPSLKSSLQLQWWEGSEAALDEEYGENSLVFPFMGGSKFEQAATFGLDDLGADDMAGSMQLSVREGAGKQVCFGDRCVGPIMAAAIGYILGRGSLKLAFAAAVAYWLFRGPDAGKVLKGLAASEPSLPTALPGEGAR